MPGQKTPRGVTSQNGNVNVDNANNRIAITDSDGTLLVLGVLLDGTFGIAFYDSSGYLLRKSNILTDYWYDKVNNVNQMQQGLLPDSSYGIVVAKSPYNVSDGVA